MTEAGMMATLMGPRKDGSTWLSLAASSARVVAPARRCAAARPGRPATSAVDGQRFGSCLEA